MAKITRVKNVDGYYYPQVMFKFLWFIPTGWWRYCIDSQYDIVDGESIGIMYYREEIYAQEYLNKL